MGNYGPLNLTNGILPMAVLVALAVGLPALFVRKTLSQRRLAWVMVGTGLVVWMVGAVLMEMLYTSVNFGRPVDFRYALGSSLMTALLWGPVLALVWLMRAQGVERRRGLLMRGGGE